MNWKVEKCMGSRAWLSRVCFMLILFCGLGATGCSKKAGFSNPPVMEKPCCAGDKHGSGDTGASSHGDHGDHPPTLAPAPHAHPDHS